MATTTVSTEQHTIPVELIDVPENVRELDAEHARALAGSIALQGVLVPLVVRPAGDRFELVAGFIASPRRGSWGLSGCRS